MKYRVLIVDEDVLFANIAKIHLSREGIDADIVASASEATDRMRNHPYRFTTVIVHDSFHCSNILDTVAKIHATNKHLRILLCSTLLSTQDRQNASQAGVTGYVSIDENIEWYIEAVRNCCVKYERQGSHYHYSSCFSDIA